MKLRTGWLFCVVVMGVTGAFVMPSCSSTTGDDGGTDGGSGDGDDGDDGDGDDDDGPSGGDDCDAACADYGFASGEVDGEDCLCDDPTDAACFNGMSGICVCDESVGSPCSNDDMFNIYVNCFQDNDGVREPVTCVNSYIVDDTIDCDAAYAGCFEDGGSGSSGTSTGGGPGCD
jgi:hypothetical protein